MKYKRIISIFLLSGMVLFGCKKDLNITDTVYEFVYFTNDAQIYIDEGLNSHNGIPVVAQLLAYEPHKTAIELGLEIKTFNTAKGVDFEFNGDKIVIPAGSLVSDTLFVKTIDNNIEDTVSRSFVIRIKSVNDPTIKIGIGLTTPKNDSIRFTIINDDFDAICRSSFWKGDLNVADVPWPDYSPTDAAGTTTDCGLMILTINDFWGEAGSSVSLDLQLNDDGTVILLNDNLVTAYGTDINFKAGNAGTYDMVNHILKLVMATDYADGQVTDGFYRLNVTLCAAGILNGAATLLDDEWPSYPTYNPHVTMTDCNNLKVIFGLWGYDNYNSEFDLEIGNFEPKTNEAPVTLKQDVIFDHDGYYMTFKAGAAGKYNLDTQSIALSITMDPPGDGTMYNGNTYEFTIKLP